MKADKTITKAWIKTQGRASRAHTMRPVVIGLLSTLIGLGQAWALAQTLTLVLTGHPEKAPASFGLFILAGIARTLLGIVHEITASSASISARRRLRSEVLNRILHEGPALLRRKHSAVIASTLVDRIDALDGYFARWLPASALWLTSQWIVIAAVAWQNHEAGLILAVCGALLPVFQAIFGIATGVASRRQFLAMTRLQTRFLDRIKGIATIVLSGGTEREAEALETSAEDLRLRTMKVLRIAFLASATTDIAMVAALVLIVIAQSHNLTGTTSEHTLTSTLFAILLVPESFASFRALSAAYQDRAHATAAAEAMHDLPVPDTSAPSENIALLTQTDRITVEARNLSFSWSEERAKALDDVSFTLQAGETLILSGPSGSGKSTLLELLLGFITPTSGQITLNGQDMTTLPPRQISDHISWIGQKPVLFAGTLRENILFANPTASEDDLIKALKASALDHTITSLPDGLNTRIGEGGYGLSGGQAQRIAIARAFLKNAPLLLLDEPTAHLDPVTEANILQSLKELVKGRTVILCTHSQQAKQFPGQHLSLHHGRCTLRTEEAA